MILSGVTGGCRRLRDVKVMDLFMLCVPSTAARYEGQSWLPLHCTLGFAESKAAVEMLMVIYQDGTVMFALDSELLHAGLQAYVRIRTAKKCLHKDDLCIANFSILTNLHKSIIAADML